MNDERSLAFQRKALSKEIEIIKNSVILSDVVRSYGVDLRRSGRGLTGNCPFHADKTPSFVVYDESQRYHCFGCHANGDVFEFLCTIHNISFKQALEYLSGRFSKPLSNYNLRPIQTRERKQVEIEYYDKIPTFDIKYIYNSKREIFNEVKNPDKIYTYYDEDKRAVGYVIRIIKADKSKTFLQVALREHVTLGLVWAFGGMNTPAPLYNLAQIMAITDKPVLVVEGEKCAEAARELLTDFVVTTWSGGSNAVDKTDWRILAGREVYIWPDKDTPGKEAAEKIAENLHYCEIITTRKEWPKHWDIADEIEKGATKQDLTDFILSFRVPSKLPTPVRSDYIMPPGLLGDLAKYIYDSSPQPHVVLSIGAAISIMALLQSQKCMTEDGINPNIYVVTLAASGSGKSFPFKMIMSILNCIGCGHLISNKPASGPGLISALHRRKGRLLAAIDEFGAIFSALMATDTSGYQKDIIPKMLTLFSQSDSQYNDEELSDRDKQREPRIIHKPHLIVYGTSVPDNFYSAVNTDYSINGFLARLLVLQGIDVHTPYKESMDLVQEMPENLKNSLKNWAYDPINIWYTDSPDYYDFAPIKIPYELEARKLLHKFRDEVTEIAIDADKKGDKFKESVYRRNFEMASKLALLARTNSEYIDKSAVDWATTLMKQATELYCKEALDYISETPFERKSKQIERYIKNKKTWVSMRELFTNFSMRKREMEDYLTYLLAATKIELKSLKTSPELPKKETKRNPLYRYNFNRKI